ncbi:hypothetical protein ACG9ZL_19950 [Acinetobacter sp. ULE_I057]|uniref:hypothetical protein n=1 Tax=Acinetobacter sp. ULE_I057 TaxID=3373070 RepID=UPI003AF6959C
MDKFNEFYENLELQCLSLQEVAELSYAAGQQSRQAEFDAMTEALLNQTQLLAKQKAEVEEKDKRIEGALFQIRQKALSLKEDCDGYKDPVGICQSEGIDWCVRFLEKALRGEHANS